MNIFSLSERALSLSHSSESAPVVKFEPTGQPLKQLVRPK